jgi:serine/threonine protein kinase
LTVGLDYLVMDLIEGIAHRDLKPGNIKIKTCGTVEVPGSGLAKVAKASASDSADSPAI